jgi:hypothetical protein
MQKLKKAILAVFVYVILQALTIAAMWYGTSAEVWYAGMHTATCDNSQDCGCYAKLIAMDNE